MRMVEKSLLLQIVDQIWKEHLLQLDHMRQGIHLRGYGQRDPLNEYRSEAFALFEQMLVRVRESVTSTLAHVHLHLEEPPEEMLHRELPEMHEGRVDPALAELGVSEDEGQGLVARSPVRTRNPAATMDPEDPATWGKVPRNQTCPCGSGRKYKHCHGRI
jgi:preprotein translocase subunit SecA